MDKLKKLRIKRTRGYILLFLNKNPSVPLTFRDIFDLLDDYNCRVNFEDLWDHLNYLKGKGLVEIDRKNIEDVKISTIKITPTGENVADGFMEDIGISMEF